MRPHQPRQNREPPRRGSRRGHLEGQPCPGHLVHDRQPLQGCPHEAMVVEKVIGPDVARRCRLHRDARRPCPAPLTRDLADLKLRALPAPMDVLLVHALATPPAQRPHAPVPRAGRPVGEFVDLLCHLPMAIRTLPVADGRAVPRQQHTGPPLRHPPGEQALDGLTARRSRHDWCARNPCRASPSSSGAASRRVRRACSRARARQRWASETGMPPNFGRQRSKVVSVRPWARHSRLMDGSPRSACGKSWMICSSENRLARLRGLPRMRGLSHHPWPSFRGADHGDQATDHRLNSGVQSGVSDDSAGPWGRTNMCAARVLQ